MIDFRPIAVMEGMFLLALGILMLVPAAVDWSISHSDWQVFALSAFFTIFTGGMMLFSAQGSHIQLNIRQGFLLTTTSWITTSLFAALPFTFADIQVSYTDAFFEAVSGLTTTGSTILSGLDDLPPGLLLWRSLLQWVGGIGIIVMAVAMLPFLRVGGMQLFRMESSDTSDKILPRAGQIAKAITTVYCGLTLACTIAYQLCGMTLFEAVNHAMTTISTGGYSTSDQSMGYFLNPATHWVAVIFMLLGGMPFVLYIKTLHGEKTSLIANSQVQAFLLFLATVISALSLYLVLTTDTPALDAVRLVTFNVVSVVTTTGYAVGDYSLWGAFALMAFFFLTFAGGCTGSTAGGIKIFRFEVMFRFVRRIFLGLIFRHGIHIARYEGRPIPEDVIRAVGIFLFQFALITTLIAGLLAWMGLDFITSFSGAATAMANVGPGLGEIIGPAGNFASLPDMAKWTLSFAMLIGRLEIATVLVLVTPLFWRD